MNGKRNNFWHPLHLLNIFLHFVTRSFIPGRWSGHLLNAEVIVIIIAVEALRNSNETGNIFAPTYGCALCSRRMDIWAAVAYVWSDDGAEPTLSNRIRIYFDVRRINL